MKEDRSLTLKIVFILILGFSLIFFILKWRQSQRHITQTTQAKKQEQLPKKRRSLKRSDQSDIVKAGPSKPLKKFARKSVRFKKGVFQKLKGIKKPFTKGALTYFPQLKIVDRNVIDQYDPNEILGQWGDGFIINTNEDQMAPWIVVADSQSRPSLLSGLLRLKSDLSENDLARILKNYDLLIEKSYPKTQWFMARALTIESLIRAENGLKEESGILKVELDILHSTASSR